MTNFLAAVGAVTIGWFVGTWVWRNAVIHEIELFANSDADQ